MAYGSRNEYDHDYQAWMEENDVSSHMSLSEIAHNDRMDYANEVAAAGDPERAMEIRMGA